DVILELSAVLACGQDFGSAKLGREIRTAIRLKGGRGKLEDIDSRESENTAQADIGEYPDHLVVAYGADRYLGTANMTSLYAPEQEIDPIASRISSTSEMYDPEEIINHLDNAARTRTDDTPEQAKDRKRQGKLLSDIKDMLAKVLPHISSAADMK